MTNIFSAKTWAVSIKTLEMRLGEVEKAIVTLETCLAHLAKVIQIRRDWNLPIETSQMRLVRCEESLAKAQACREAILAEIRTRGPNARARADLSWVGVGIAGKPASASSGNSRAAA